MRSATDAICLYCIRVLQRAVENFRKPKKASCAGTSHVATA